MVEMQKKSKASEVAESTQKHLPISEIKDSMIVMKDGSLRAVIALSSTNFSLKSEEEQNAITAAYQNFVNALEFPIQILVHSRILDINGYLEKLRNLSLAQTNELLRIQMTEYIEYVSRLVEYASIMSKSFYVVVPYSAGGPVKEGFAGRLKKFFNPAAEIALHEEAFERYKVKLEERVNQVVGALGGMGLRNVVLNTADLIELLYQSYNFESASPLHAEEIEELELKA